MSAGNSANLLQSEFTPESKIKPRRNKSSEASDAPPSSSDRAREKQHSSKWRKKEVSGTTTSSFLVSPPVTPESQLYQPSFPYDPEAYEQRGSMPLSLHLQERSIPEASSSKSATLSMSEQFLYKTDSPGSSPITKYLTNNQKRISAPQMLGSRLSPTFDMDHEMSESMSGELYIYNASALASSPMTTSSSSNASIPFSLTNVSTVVNSTMTAYPASAASDPHFWWTI